MTVTTTEADAGAGQRSAPIVIVSCDTHIGPRLVDELRVYCPAGLHDEFDAFATELQEEARGGGQESQDRLVRWHQPG